MALIIALIDSFLKHRISDEYFYDVRLSGQVVPAKSKYAVSDIARGNNMIRILKFNTPTQEIFGV